MTAVADLARALHDVAGYVVVKQEMKPDSLTLYGRQPPHSRMGNWKLLRGYLWKAANGRASKRPWKVDVSCYYFVDEDAGDLQRFAWRLVFKGKDIATHYKDILQLIRTSPKAASSSLDTIEVPLPGGANRNSTAGGRRGAGAMGSVMVGAAAAARKMQGG